MQRQILKSDSKRESRNKIELVDETTLIDLVDEDNSDLMEIVKSTDIADVPPNLKLLWEQQMKQLSMKSSSGYRWDPRCCVLLSILGFHVTSYFSVGVNSKSRHHHGSELHVHCMCWPCVS